MFGKKSIRVVIQKVEGEFKEGVNTLEFKNLPIEAKIDSFGTLSMSSLRIYGISKEHVNAITMMPNRGLTMSCNLELALYVDEGAGEFLLYTGSIRDACPHYTNAPDICIDILCCTGAFSNLRANVSSNIPEGEVPVPELYRIVCESFNVKFVNNAKGTGKANNFRISASGFLARLKQIQEAYPEFTYKEINNTIFLYDTGTEKVAYNFTKDDYIGYPTFNQTGISLNFDRLIVFSYADAFSITDSELDLLNQNWQITSCTYNISTKIGGVWEMNVNAIPLGE